MNFNFKEINKPMPSATYTKFLNFLQNELALSSESIAVAQRHEEKYQGPLPMILWKYGLVTLEELDRIYDWLETV